MPYEEIQGVTEPIVLNNDVGFSGNSTEWDGADQSYVKVYWTSTGGITNSNNWANFNYADEITVILESSNDVGTKKELINKVIYPQVTQLLNSTDQDAWGSFRNHYYNCVSVGK